MQKFRTEESGGTGVSEKDMESVVHFDDVMIGVCEIFKLKDSWVRVRSSEEQSELETHIWESPHLKSRER